MKQVTVLFPLLQMKSVPYKLQSANQTLAGHHPTRACSRSRAASSPWRTPPTVTTARRLRPSTRAVYWIGIWTTRCGTWWWQRRTASPRPARGGATPSRSAPTSVIEMLYLRRRPTKQRPTLSTTWVRDVSVCHCAGEYHTLKQRWVFLLERKMPLLTQNLHWMCVKRIRESM